MKKYRKGQKFVAVLKYYGTLATGSISAETLHFENPVLIHKDSHRPHVTRAALAKWWNERFTNPANGSESFKELCEMVLGEKGE